jgi:hypothetical protein
MLSWHSRRTALAVTLVMLVLGSSIAVTGSSARRAAATCDAVGVPHNLTRYDNGTLVAEEAAPYPFTTCNGDSQYTGILLDPVTDGSCAYVYYLEPLAYYANQATSCTTGAWVSYNYADSIGTNNVFVSARPSYAPDDWKFSSGY